MSLQIESLRKILADELAKLPNIPPHLIEQVRQGTHGPNIKAALAAMRRAVIEDRYDCAGR